MDGKVFLRYDKLVVNGETIEWNQETKQKVRVFQSGRQRRD